MKRKMFLALLLASTLAVAEPDSNLVYSYSQSYSTAEANVIGGNTKVDNKVVTGDTKVDNKVVTGANTNNVQTGDTKVVTGANTNNVQTGDTKVVTGANTNNVQTGANTNNTNTNVTTGANTNNVQTGANTNNTNTKVTTGNNINTSAGGAGGNAVNTVTVGCVSDCGKNSAERIAADKEIAAAHDQALRDVANSKIRNTPSMLSPALVSSNDTCMGSTSGSVAAPGLGLGFGTTWVDENCKMLKNSQALWNMGFRSASVALLCNDEKIRSALEITGYPCPAKPAVKSEVKSYD